MPHKKLLWKLENFGGLKGKILAWMTDFLVGREMRSDQGVQIKLEKGNKWCSTGFSFCSSHVCRLH